MFRSVEEQRGALPIDRESRVINVSPRGLRAIRRRPAFRSRPASRRQHMDMVVLAHIKKQSRLSLGSHGRPRMTDELKEVGVDVGHRRVISWAVSNRMKRDLAFRALRMAIALRAPTKGCIFHRERQSRSRDYQKVLREHGLPASISGKGNGCDNAAALRRENNPLDCLLILLTFFKTIKAALIWRRSWDTRRAAETAVFQYINGFHNPRRQHSALGGKSPLAFERQVA